MSDLVVLERPVDGVAVVTLNRPEKRNALSIALRDECTELLTGLRSDESLKCVVVTGAGVVFSAGFDLTEFDAAATDPSLWERLWASSDQWHEAWLRFPLPTIAAVNGAALAGGFDLAVMCDLRVVAVGARFAHPEITFGDVVYGPLHDLVGGSLARDLALTGREITAEEAFDVRLANRLVGPGDARAEALRLADVIIRAPREVLLRMKAKVLRRGGLEPGRTLDL